MRAAIALLPRVAKSMGLIAILALLFFTWASPPAHAVQIKRVQTGDVYLDADDMSTSIPVLAVNQSKTLILLYEDVDVNTTNYPRENLFTAQFESDSSIVIARDAASVGCTVRYYLVEFEDGVLVQRGISSFLYGNYNNPDYRIKNVTLPVSVDADKAVAFVHVRCNHAQSTTDEIVHLTASMVDDSTMRLERNATSDYNRAVNIVWQVVEFQTDTSIRTGEVTIGINQTAGTGPISPVIPDGKLNKSLLLFNYRTMYGVNGIEGRSSPTGTITDESTVTFTRSYQNNTANTQVYVRWYALEFTDESSLVQTLNVPIASGTSSSVSAIPTEIDPTRSFPFIGVRGPADTTTTYEHEISFVPEFDLAKGVAYDPSTDSVWAAGYYSNKVYKFNADNGALIGSYNVGTRPIAVCYDSQNSAIWVANNASNNVTKLLASNGGLVGTYGVGTNPTDIAFDATSNSVWTVNYGSSNVTKLTASTGALVNNYSTYTTYPTSICYEPGATPRMWVSYWASDRISNFGCNTGTRADADVGSTNQGYNRIRFADTTTGGLAYTTVWLASLRYNYVTRIRCSATGTRFIYYPDLAPQGMAYDGANIWVVNYASNTMNKLNPAATVAGEGVVGTYATGTNPYDVVYDSTNSMLWVAGASTRSVQKFNLSGVLQGTYLKSENESTLALTRTNNGCDVTADWSVVEFSPITLKTPNGSEVWHVGDTGATTATGRITWKHAASLESSTVDLLLSYDGGTNYPLTITTAVNANQDYYAWTIPESLGGENLMQNDLRVRIIQTGTTTADRQYDDSNADFEIKGTITVTAPNSGETWFVADTNRQITWTKTGNFDPEHNAAYAFSMKLSEDGGDSYGYTVKTGLLQADVCSGNSCTWTWEDPDPGITGVPDKIGVDRRIKVYLDNDETNVHDESDADFFIKGKLQITSPNLGTEQWLTLNTYPITWNKTGTFSEVSLYYSKNSGVDYVLIEAAQPAGTTTGSYDWLVPVEAMGNATRVKVVSDQVAALQIDDASDADFAVVPSIGVTSPNTGNEVWYVTGNGTITWDLYGSMTYVHCWYSKDGGDWTRITPSGGTPANNLGGGHGSYDWSNIPDIISNNVLIRVAEADGDITPGQPYDDSDNVFRVKGKLSIVSPNGSEVFTVGTAQNIEWDSYGSSLGNVAIKFARNGVDFTTVLTPEPAGVPASDETFSWDPIPDLTTASGKIRIELISDPSVVNTTSADAFAIKGALALNAPNGGSGQFFNVNEHTSITWTPTGTVGNVELRFSTDSGSNFPDGNIIATGLDPITDSPYDWTVPDAISSTVKVRVAKVGDTYISDMSDNNFSIKGSITLTRPDGGETFYVQTSEPITWTRFGSSMGDISIHYSINDGEDGYPNQIVASVASSAGTYSWNVADAIGSQLKVKLALISDPDTNDTSEDVFNIKGRFSLLAPTGGETWYVGTAEDISWDTYGSINKVNLYYSINGGGNYGATINTGISNIDSFAWTIPDAIGSQVRVKVESFYDDTVIATSPANFTIKGRIVVTSPNGTEVWRVKESRNITWNPYGAIGNVEIRYSTNGGTLYDHQIIDSAPAASGTYPWEVPDAIGTSLKVKIISISDNSVNDESNNNFEIKGVLALTAPNGGQTFYVGDSTNIAWTKEGTLGNVELRYSKDSGATYPEGQIIVTAIAATATPYSWEIPDALGAQTRVKVMLLSDADNVNDESNADFTIKGKLKLDDPDGGESWEAESSHNILWTPTGSIANVELRYSIDGGSSYGNIIIASTPAATGSYPWLIPDAIGNQVKVKVSDASDTLVNDESDANFAIKGKLVILHPNGGETLNVNQSYTIDWNDYGTILKVNLLYSTDGGENYGGNIIAALDNSGSYGWTVPDAIGTQVRVRVENNADTNVFDTSDANFTVKGSVTLTSPNGSEEWVVDDPHNITWTKTGSIGNVKLEYSTNAGSSYDYEIANPVNGNDLSYPWTTPDAIGANVKVKITCLGDTSVTDESADVFTIKGSIHLDSPNGGEALSIGGSHDVTWTKHGTLGNVKLEYSTNGGTSYDYTITTSTGSGTGTFEWANIADTPTTQAKVKITRIADETVTDTSDINFRIKAAINLTAPDGGQTWVVGDTEGITWTKNGTITEVVLEYSVNSGVVYPYTIATVAGDALSHPWTIPDAIGTHLRVRIRNTADSTVNDFSNSDFTVKGYVELSYPNGGEVFAVDSSYTITWTKRGSFPNVKLLYSTTGAAPYSHTIIESTPTADLSYFWTVPDTLSATCKVQIQDAVDDTVADTSNGNFKIRGNFILTAPNGLEAWSINTPHDITWARTGSIALAKLEYSTNGFSDELQTYTIIASTDATGTPPGSLKYTWTIPDTPSSTVKVRISDASDSTVYDTSNATFRIIGNVTISSPNGAEEWVVDDVHNITWTKFGNIANVKLMYSIDSGSTYPEGNTIIASTPASDLSYSWTIPDDLTTQGRVKINDTGDATVSDQSNADFIIKGSVTVVSPNGGQTWIVGESRSITWTRTGSFANVKLEYSTNGFSDEDETIVITNSTPAVDLSFPWTVPDAIGTALKVRITDVNNSTVTDMSNTNFIIKGALTLNSPNGTETWVVGETRAISWTRTGSIANVKLEYSTDGGSTYPNTIVESTPANASYDWTVADAIGTELRVRVSDVTDSSVHDISNANFTVKGSLILAAPNGSEEWVVESSHDIAWTKTGTLSTVKLEYSTNGFSDELQTYLIIASTDATGTPPGSLKYSWTIPDALSATVKVRITNNSDETVKDSSNSNFKIKGSFTLTAPNGSEDWSVGTAYNVVWTMKGTIQNAKLELSTNGGTSYGYTIIGSTPAGGLNYSWTIPDQITTQAKVKISDVSDASVSDESNANFAILGKFAVTSPNGSEVWVVSDAHDITWGTTGTVNNVKLEYSTDAGATFPFTIIASTPNNNAYEWTIPDAISNSVRVRVSDAGNADANDMSNANFKIRGALQVTSPNNGTESWSAGSSYPVTWNRTGAISLINIYYSYDDGSNWVKINTNPVDASLGTWSWSIPGDVILSTQALIKVVDSSDSVVYDESDNNFQVKGGLSLVTPSDSGISMEVGSSYNITWNKFGAIGNIQIHYSVNGGIAGGGAYPDPDNLIAVTPASDLSYMWSVPDKIGTNLRARVRDANNFSVWDESNNTFTVKGRITVDLPNGGESWYVGDTNQVKWTPWGTYAQVKLEYSTNAFANELQTFAITTLPAGSSGVQQSYDWTVPDKIGVNLKVRASDNNNAEVVDVSDATFIIKGKLSLTGPNGTESWIVDSAHNITWTRTGSVANVKLEYSTDGGTTYSHTIVESTDGAAGTYPWTIPDAIGNGLRVRVSDVTDASVLDASNANFSIKGSLTLTSPNGSEAWLVDSDHDITWSKHGTIPSVELRYSKDGGSNYSFVIVASTDGGDLSYAWQIPDEISATLKVKITNVDDDTVFDVSDSNFKIIGAVVLTAPNGGQELVVGAEYNVTWSLTGTVSNVRLEYSTNSGGSYPNLIIGSTPGGSYSYTWTIPNAVSTAVRVKVSDAADVTVADESNADFTIMPGFEIIAPNGGEAWAVESSQDITWDTTGSCSNVKLEYSVNGGTNYTNIVASTPNTELYAWTIPDTISTNCKVRISDVDNPTALDATDGVFKIRGSVQLTSPNGTESWDVASVHAVTWTRTGSVPFVKLEYSTDGGLTYPGLIIASIDASLGTRNWTIPDSLSTQMRVKVTDTADSTVYDASDANFTVKGAVTLNTPNGGEDLTVGTSTNITWTRFGSIQNVKLEYSTNSGSTYPHLIIAATDASTLSYNWAIPDAIGTQVRVRVTDADNSLVFDASNADFSIKGAVTLNTPNGGEVWYVGESRNITWTRTGSFPTLKIEYSVDGGSTYPNVIAPSLDASLETYPWTIPDAIGIQLKVKVTDIANSSVTDESNSNFTVKGVLELSTPNGGETWVVGNSQNIAWTRTGSIATAKLEYSTNGGSNYPYTIIASTDASTGLYSWTVSDAIGTQVKVRITDTSDAAVYDVSNGNFTIKGALLLTAPNGAEAWTVGTVHNVTWTRTGSIANVKLTYSLDGGVSYPGTIIASTDASTGSYAWSIPDSPNTTVKVRVNDVLDDTVADISDANFKIIGSLTLTAPNGGEKWGINLQKKITWTMVGSIANVKLEYSTNSGSSYDFLIIGSTAAGALEYYWTLPDTASTTTRVKISDASDATVNDASSADFKIQVRFTLTAPNGGEVWQVDGSENIAWTNVGTTANVKLQYSTDGGANFNDTIAASTSNTGTYAWEIPDEISATLRVRISDTNDSEAFDDSDVNFKIRGAFTLGAPNGGEVWIVSSHHDITWTRVGSIATAKLEYSVNGGTTYPNTIVASLDASLGAYDWTIPDAIGSQLRVRISDTSDSTVLDNSDNNFFIKGALVLSSPNGTEQWIVGSGHNITWTRTGSIATAKLEYSKNSGSTFPYTIIASTDASTLAYNWPIPDEISTFLRVRITDTTDNQVTDMSNADFAIRGSLTLTSPNGGEIWNVGEPRSITWTRVGSIVAVKLEYSTNGGSTYPNVIIPSTDAAAGTYAWTVPDAIGSQLRVKVTDTSNSVVTDASDSNFTVKGFLTLTSPNGGETWVVGSNQNVTWTPTGTIALVKLEYSTDGGNTYPYTIIESTNGPAGTYSWTIPDAIGSNLKVRVLDASDNSVSDFSNAVFAVKGSLTVTAPNGGEAWGVANSQDITWNKTGSIATIKIDYSVDGGSNYPNTIDAAADAATGSYAWTIPDNLTSTAKVKITNNADNSVYDASDANFKIVGILTLTAPNGGEAWGVNTNHNITWTRVGSVANVRLDYSVNGGTTYPNTITASTPAGALSFTWTIPDAVGAQVQVRISDASDISVVDTSDANFTIQARFDVTSPDGGEVWVVASSHDITWSTIGSATTVRLDYSTDGGSNYPNNITTSTANTGSFPWTVPDSISSQLRVKVSDYNNSNAFDASAANFKIRGSVTLTSPNGNEAWIVNSGHNVTWTIVGSIANVKLEYSTDSGATYPFVIIASTAAPAGTYAWTIPDNLSQTCKVKVTDTTDSIVYDVSDNTFKIRGDLTLTSPNGAEEWEVGSAHDVTWTRVGAMQNVKLEYSLNGGSSYPYVIVGSTDASTGTYPWVIPDAIGNQSRVRVSDASDATVYDGSNANFKIKGVILVTSPNGTERWEVASAHNITWSITGTIANIKLEYSTNGGSSYDNTIVASVNAGLGTYAWTIPDSIGAQVRVKATNLSDLAVYDTSDANFNIIGKIIVNAPNGGEVWPVGSSEAVTWSRIGTIASVKLEYSTDGGVQYPNVIIASTPAATGSYNWVLPDAITSTARVRASDVSDSSVYDISDGNFKIRGNLTLTTPNGAEVWLINSSHDIVWTRFGSIANARLEYSINGGTNFPYTIIGSVDASLQRYSWTIPDNPSIQCKVKISDAADVTVFDSSNGNFIIRGGFELGSPDGGEVWAVGSAHNITWSTFGSIANVKLEYSPDNTAHWYIITGSVSNTGIYPWTIPDAISTQCIVRITDTGDPEAYDLSDAVFKIHGLLVLTSPNGGEEWAVGSSHSITWTKTGSIGNARLEYSTNGGSTYPNLIADPVAAGNLSYNWTVPDAISTIIKVKISVSSDATVYDVSDNNFKIKGSFSITAPNGGESWTVATGQSITWTTLGTVANVKLDYSTNAGSDWTVIVASVANINSYPWTVPDAIATQCRVRVSDASDSSALDISDNNFKISGSLTITAPNGGEKWAVGSSQIITWGRVGSIANVRLEYSDNNGVSYIPIINSTPNAGSYAWTIPNAITTTALVKVSNVDDLTISDASNAVFKIQAGFTVSSPNGGEAWLVGSGHDITWTWNGTVPNVALHYSADGGTNWIEISTSYSNNGTYTWTVPDSVGGTVKVRVADTRDLEANDTSNSNFRIRCAFTLGAPNGAELWDVGSSRNITWGNIGTIANVKLVYSRDNFLTDNQVIDAAVPNLGLYAWTIPDSISNTVRIRISDPNDIGAYDDSNAEFRIIADFTVTSPNGAEKWDVDSNHDITWTWAGTVPQVKLEYSIDGGASFLLIGATDNDGAYEWLIPDTISASMRVRVSDLADATAYDVSNANAKIRAKFTLTTPNGGQLLTVGEDYEVLWECVGTVANVKLEYSTDDFVTANLIIASTPNDLAYTWRIPNDPSVTVKVRVSSATDVDAYDISDAVSTIVRGNFIITSPNGGERWVTREEHNISWTNTSGYIPKVNIYYSKNNFASDEHVIVSDLDNPIAPSSNSYSWVIPDDRSATVRVRIADIRDITVNDTSDADFEIDYYTLNWQIRDLLTNAHLSQLTVESTSDKGDEWKTSSMPNNPNAPLGSPVSIDLPYGFWTTLWSKTEYGDKQFNFMCDRDMDVETLFMETSAVHIWRAYSDFAYDPTLDSISVSSWMERDGYVVSGAARVDVYVCDPEVGCNYDPAKGPLVFITQLTDDTPDNAGFFNTIWPATGLVAGKVYTTITDITNASGVHFKTPDSFSITEAQKLQDVQDTVNSVLDKPISQVNQELQETLGVQTSIIQSKLDDQKTMIEVKMDEQKEIIEQKTDEMMESVNSTLSAFETRTNEAIVRLEEGADTAIDAGQELQATAKKYSWQAVAAPDPALSNDDITISLQGQPNLAPMLSIYSWDNNAIFSGIIMQQVKSGLYTFSFKADDSFDPGKAYTFMITESITGGLVAGSGMVESMSITTVAGLASAAPEAERAAKKALEAIKAVESVLLSGESDNMNIALTLKNLKESVDDLPNVIANEGPTARIVTAVNQISDSLKALIGTEGFDIGTLLEGALSSSPTIKDIRGKTDEINQIIEILMQLFESKFGGKDTPILSTSMQPGSVRFKIVAFNPSKLRPQKVSIKNYLPEEAKPKDVLDLGGLELEYDSQKSIYYVYRDGVELNPGEMRVFDVEVEDIWFVPQPVLSDLKERTETILGKLEGSVYYDRAKEIADTIYPRLEEVTTSQNDESVSRETHIGIYRQNLKVVEQIKEDLAKLEKTLATAGGPLAPEMLKSDKIKSESPTETMTWVVVFIVIIFVGLLAGVLFFTWHRQTRMTREELLAAKKSAFSGSLENQPEKQEKKE